MKRRLAAILISTAFLPFAAGAAERPASPMEKDLRELYTIADSYPTRAKTPEQKAQALGLWQSVEARLVKELQASPHDFDLELWLGDCYRMGHNLNVVGAWDKAVLHLKEAARLRPESPVPPLLLGEHYASSGHAAESEALLLRALKLSGDKPPASIHQYLAVTYYQLGQFDKVVAQADLYLKTDPDSQLITVLKERSEAALHGGRKPKTFEVQPRDEKAAEPASFLLYYKKPEPDRFPALLADLQKEGALALGHMTAAGFLSQVFHDNPDRLNGWAPGFWKLGDAPRAYIWLSLWFSNTAQAKAILEDAERKENGVAAASVTKLLKVPSKPLLELPIDSGSSLDLLWGAFFATGRQDYVARIIDCLPWSLLDPKVDKLKVAVGRAAEWSLRTNAGRDPHVLEICKTELARRDGDTRTVLAKVIREVPSG